MAHKTVEWKQDLEGEQVLSGRITMQITGIDIEVEWFPGFAAQGREDLRAAVEQVLASIKDPDEDGTV